MQTSAEAIQIAELIKKYLQQTISAAEQAELDRWLASSSQNQKLFDELTDEKKLVNELAFFHSISTAASLEKIRKQVSSAPVVSIKNNFRRWWAAAAIFILISGGTYFLFNKTGKDQPITGNQKPAIDKISPGGNKAVLTLADGSIIILDSATNGTLTQQGNTKVSKLDDGQLAYNASGDAEKVLYNTISTPRGGQYQMTLSDGSKVWLNAASSIRFPVAFINGYRKVDISGEAYFEIKKDPSKPFIVNMADKGEVEVLGTHFNINSYDDESDTKVTLLEGSVKVSNNVDSKTIRPGQQAQVTSSLSVLNNVNTDEIIAWKNSLFYFDRSEISVIMRQVSRWYDVDVLFEGVPAKKTFSGIVSRSNSINDILEIMKKAGVSFRIEGKKVTVLR